MTLLSRLEAATVGSRELDAEIHAFIGGEDCRGDERLTEFVCPEYSSSIDAALTLVPEGGEDNGNGWRIGLERGPGRKTYWTAWLRRHAADAHFEGMAIHTAPAALALVIAALKARSAP